jgi:microcystin-dependent protein
MSVSGILRPSLAPGISLTNGEIAIYNDLIHCDISNQMVGILTVPDPSANYVLTVSGDVRVRGSLRIEGSVQQIDIDEFTSETLTIENDGTGPALVVNQSGAQDVARFQDDKRDVLVIKDGGNVGVGKSNPSYSLDVSGTSNSNAVYQAGALLMPTGAITAYISTTAPQGWLVCDGTAVSRSTYSALFSVIGTSFGIGDGVTTFNLPDTRGKMFVSYNSGDASFNAVGNTGGSKTATLTTSELPAHTHTGTTDSAGSHSHSINDPGHTHTQTTINDDFNNSGGNPPGFTGDSAGSVTWNNINSSTTGITIVANGAHTHTFTTGSTGSGSAFSIMNPYFTVTYIIKY